MLGLVGRTADRIDKGVHHHLALEKVAVIRGHTHSVLEQLTKVQKRSTPVKKLLNAKRSCVDADTDTKEKDAKRPIPLFTSERLSHTSGDAIIT